MARISLVLSLITIIALVNAASARDVKLIKFKDAGRNAKPEIRAQSVEKKALAKVLEEVKSAKAALKDLQAKEKNVSTLKKELKFLSQSESLLERIVKTAENGGLNRKKTDDLIKKLVAFHDAWKLAASNAVVTEKEREYMVKVGEIVNDLKKEQNVEKKVKAEEIQNGHYKVKSGY